MFSPSTTPPSDETIAILQVARTSGVGPVTFQKLLARFGSALVMVSKWDEIAPHLSKRIGPLASRESAIAEYAALAKLGGTMVVWGTEHYPGQLTILPDPPLVLSVLGDASLLKTKQIAIVGNRSASGSGLSWTRELASGLARAGLAVTSGLARGIDGAAHEGALAAQGATLAIVAGGVDHVYPPEHAELRKRIITHGAVVSEQPLGSVPTAQMFPRRNRIIAGLATGVVVSEASKHSGSLITAQHALEYGREVFAVPGSPTDPRASGPNWLLKNGAILTEGVEDIVRQLPPEPRMQRSVVQQVLFTEAMVEEPAFDAGDIRQVIYSLLGKTGLSMDELVRHAGCGEAELSSLLVEMELDGLAQREPDGRWCKAA